MIRSLDLTSPTSFTTFGDLLKYLRRREHLTQLELSINVGYSESQISRLEQSQRLPDPTSIKALFIPALHLEDDPHLAVRLLELAKSARQENAPTPGISPYKGLLFFDESDSDLFFGREALTARLVRHVMDLSSEASTRFLAVVGASGSGKSSLVRAGLAVALKRAGWDTRVFAPTANPLRMLETKLDPTRFLSSERVLILVDQFEEVFTLCHDEMERIAFIEKLLSIAQDPSKKTSVVIALRADFYSHCAEYPLLRQAVAAEQEYIGQMTIEELRRAIEEPAIHGGWQFEPGLVDILLNDIGAQGASETEPGALPLLSHALLATWERRRDRTLTLAGYHASGGVRGSIAETAESVFTDQLNQTQQEIAREVFLRLTELGEGTEDTRRRAALNELVRQSGEATQLRAVLNTLAEARLITINEDNAEVAHEALIREWQRLHEWLMQDREGLLLHRHLTESAYDWEARRHDPAELYRGARLAQAREWVSTNEARLNITERDFLDASIEQEEREAMEREAQRQRELEAAQRATEAESQRAEEQARSASRLRRRALYLVGALLLALVMAGMAVALASRNSTLAVQNASIAKVAQAASTQAIADFTRSDAQRLAAEADSLMKSGADPQLIALLSLRSITTQHTLEGDTALNGAARLALPIQTFLGHKEPGIWSVAFSPDGKYVLTGGYDSTVRLWDTHTGQEVRQFPGNFELNAVFSSDGRYILIGSTDGTVQLLELESGRTIQRFSCPQESLWDIAYSPDGKYMAIACPENLAILWDIKTGQELHRLLTHTGILTAVAFSPDSKYVLTASDDKTVSLWQVESGDQLQVFTGHKEAVWSVAFSPDGKYIVTGSRDRTAKLWDVQTGQELRQFTGHAHWVNAVAISPDGRYLLTGSSDKTVKLWDIQTGLELQQYSGQAGPISSVAFSPDGRYVLSGSFDGSAWLWDTRQASGEYPPLLHGHSVHSVAFSPDGQQVVTGGADNIARLWGVRTGKVLREFTGHEAWIFSVAFSQDGHFILSGGGDGTARLWDAQTGEMLRTFDGHEIGVSCVAFSPDGRSAVTSDWAGIARVWDTRTGRLKTRFVIDPTWNYQVIPFRPYGVSFSPDGKTVLASSDDHLVGLWDAQTGSELRMLKGHTEDTFGVAFSPDGRYALSAGYDKLAILWDVQTGKEIQRLSGHTAFVYDVAFSPDGNLALTGSADNTARLWDIETGLEMRRFTGHTGPVEVVAFSPDGKVFVTASDDGTVRSWDVDYHDTMHYLCSHLLRDFTDQERVQYNLTDNKPTCPTQ